VVRPVHRSVPVHQDLGAFAPGHVVLGQNR
jgi:hypothetical protein